MQQNLTQVVFLLGFQLKSVRERITCGIVLAFVFLLTAYGIDLLTAGIQTQLNEAGPVAAGIERVKTAPLHSRHPVKPAAGGTINTSVYEAKIHWAIPYVPLSPDEMLIKARPGYRFVVLDMSFRNTTRDQEVDMRLALLTATLRDEQDREYFSDALAIASLQREYPFPQHDLSYSKIRGVLKPGEVYRTTIFAFEVPVDRKNFILVMEDGGRKKHQLHRASFSVKEDDLIRSTSQIQDTTLLPEWQEGTSFPEDTDEWLQW
jgi:hypothetical protein